MKFNITNKTLIPSVVILMGILFALAFLLRSFNLQNPVVRIKKGNQIVEEIRMSDVEDYEIVNLGTNKVRIEHDGVYMENANCPDKLCVHQGRISKTGQSIICLPNKIIVEIVGKKPDVDAVSGAR